MIGNLTPHSTDESILLFLENLAAESVFSTAEINKLYI